MEPTKLKDFDINIYKLAEGVHAYEFYFNSYFFELFEDRMVEKGNGTIHLTLTRNPTLISLQFKIGGTLELICDRSLEAFNHPINIEQELILKFGDHEEELDESINLINWNTQIVNIAHWIYEFIGLSIPMKKLHPRYQDDDSEDGILYSTEDSNPKASYWNALKDLKNKFDN